MKRSITAIITITLFVGLLSGCSSTMTEEEYSNELYDVTEELANDMELFFISANFAIEDSTAFQYEEWQNDIASDIDNVEYSLDRLQAMRAPSKYKEVDRHLKTAIKGYRSVPEKMPRAIRNQDIDEFFEVDDDINKAKTSISEAYLILESYGE